MPKTFWKPLTYIGFVVVVEIKIFGILAKTTELTEIVQGVAKLYPRDENTQREYGVKRLLHGYYAIGCFFIVVHLILIWSHDLYSFLNYLIYDYWLHVQEIPKGLPYFCWVPFDWHDHWPYYIMYVSQALAGITCMHAQIAADVLLCAIILHLIMHFRPLASVIERHVTNAALSKKSSVEDNFRRDMQFMKDSLDYHQQILMNSLVKESSKF